jgi:hypothetical protein
MYGEGSASAHESKNVCTADAEQHSRSPDQWEDLLTHETVRQALASVRRKVGLEEEAGGQNEATRRWTGTWPMAGASPRSSVAAAIAGILVLIFGFGTGLALQEASSGRLIAFLTAEFRGTEPRHRAMPAREVAPAHSMIVAQAEADKAGLAFWEAIQTGRSRLAASTDAPRVMPAAGMSIERAASQQLEARAIARVAAKVIRQARFSRAVPSRQQAGLVTAAAAPRRPTIQRPDGSTSEVARLLRGGSEVAVAAVPPHPVAEPAEAPGVGAPASASAIKISDVRYVAVTTKASNFRDGPTISATRLGTLMKGTSVVVLGKVDGANWLQIQRPQGMGGVAYIYAPLLSSPGGGASGGPEAQAKAEGRPEAAHGARRPPRHRADRHDRLDLQ